MNINNRYITPNPTLSVDDRIAFLDLIDLIRTTQPTMESVDRCVEELAELIQALQKTKRNGMMCSDNLKMEMAHAELMMEVVCDIFNISNADKIKECMNVKERYMNYIYREAEKDE